MEENNQNSLETDDETSPEEKLQNANLNADKLIEELNTKRNEYTTVLTELTQRKECIESMLNELTSAKVYNFFSNYLSFFNQKYQIH